MNKDKVENYHPILKTWAAKVAVYYCCVFNQEIKLFFVLIFSILGGQTFDYEFFNTPKLIAMTFYILMLSAVAIFAFLRFLYKEDNYQSIILKGMGIKPALMLVLGTAAIGGNVANGAINGIVNEAKAQNYEFFSENSDEVKSCENTASASLIFRNWSEISNEPQSDWEIFVKEFWSYYYDYFQYGMSKKDFFIVGIECSLNNCKELSSKIELIQASYPLDTFYIYSLPNDKYFVEIQKTESLEKANDTVQDITLHERIEGARIKEVKRER